MKLRYSHAVVLGALSLALVLPRTSAAQGFAPPPPDQPDLTLDAATRRVVVDSLAAAVERHYVFPDRAKTTARALKKRLSGKEYDRISSAKEFADSLTAHLQHVTHDLHLRVHYRHEPLPVMTDREPTPEERAKALEFERLRNYGFERVERLAGNVGYLDLRQFSNAPEAQTVATSAMQFLGSTDAMIIDLRRNGGGSPSMIATLLTYFVAPNARLNFNNFFTRTPEGDETTQWWTVPYVPGTRHHGKPLYVLTSPLTGSAAEEFAYDVQTHKLGTLVGGTTAGAAHPGGMFRLNENFAAFIATGRAINPVTGTNWEGVGVKPEVEAKPEEALKAAHAAAIQKLMEKPRDEEHRAMLGRALEAARQRPADSAEDFVRRTRRAVRAS